MTKLSQQNGVMKILQQHDTDINVLMLEWKRSSVSKAPAAKAMPLKRLMGGPMHKGWSEPIVPS